MIIFSCKGEKGTDNLVSHNKTGDIKGIVQLIDLEGKNSATNSGVTITIDGDTLSAQTNNDGGWSIQGINEGTRYLKFTKPGFATIEEYLVNVTAENEQIIFCSMFQKPTYLIDSIYTDSSFSSTHLILKGKIKDSLCNYSRRVLFFFNSQPNVSSTYPNWKYVSTGWISKNSDTIFCVIGYSNLKINASFTSGTKVYTICYPDAFQTQRAYYSGAEFTSLGTSSNVISFIVP